MSDVVSKEEFTTALAEGYPVPHLKTQADVDGFCSRIITFFAETPNNFWIDHDPVAQEGLESPFGSILTIDFGSVPTLRVLVLPGVVRFTLVVSSMDEVDDQKAVGQAAMGVMLFCGLETGKLENGIFSKDDENPVVREQLLDDELEARNERRKALKEDVNPTPPRAGEKSYVLGGNKKFDFDWA
jgi:hypothetical protein